MSEDLELNDEELRAWDEAVNTILRALLSDPHKWGVNTLTKARDAASLLADEVIIDRRKRQPDDGPYR